MLESQIIKELKKIVGDKYVITDKEKVDAVCVDGRARRFGHALSLVLPKTTEEISRILSFANKAHLKVIAQGGNTSNVEGATPSPKLTEEEYKKFIVLKLSRMNKILEVDPINNTMAVEAGAILENIQLEAKKINRLFPISFGAQGSAQIGGVASTNAGGIHVVRYGMARDNILGLEIVLANGKVLNLMKALRKDNSGYDLKDLFIGSEGTLGVITKLILKLHPRPKERISLWVALKSLEAVEILFNELEANFGAALSAYELIGRTPIEQYEEIFGKKDLPRSDWNVLIDISVFGNTNQVYETTLEETLMKIYETAIDEAIIAKSESECEEFWKLREEIPLAVKKLGGNVKHDISLPRNKLVNFINQTLYQLKINYPFVKPSVFGHYGDGNLHFNIGSTPTKEIFKFESQVHTYIHDEVSKMNGSIAAEHGVGEMKVEEIQRLKSKEEIETMKFIKFAFDPNNTLNPGRVIKL